MKYLAGLLLVGALVSPISASAAGLTDDQVQSVLGLIKAFGGDAATLERAAQALGAPGASAAAGCQTMAVTSDRAMLFANSASSDKKYANVLVRLESCTKPVSPSVVVTFPAAKNGKSATLDVGVDLARAVETNGVWSADARVMLNAGAFDERGDVPLTFTYEGAEAGLVLNIQK